MAGEPLRYRRPITFGPGVQKAIRVMPEDVRRVFGQALLGAQLGSHVSGSRPFGEGVPRDVLKLVQDDDGETYRAAYVVAFPEIVYVLDVFQKKSKSGKGTPKADIDRVTARYKAAKQDYEVNKTTYLARAAAAKLEAAAKAAATQPTGTQAKTQRRKQ